MGMELEWKFRATPEAREAICRSVNGPEQIYEMATTYYDTPTGAFSARHCTLRRRMENDRSVCTLKTPTGGRGRNEFELESPDIQTAAARLCALSGIEELSALLQEGLQEACYARFTRIAKTVKLPECTLELALDSGVLGGGGRQQPLCEIEVELKSGNEARAEAYAMQLAVAYGLVGEPMSKFARARKLAGG